MRIQVDMNLAPKWCEILGRHGWEAVHWSTIGNSSAADRVLMQWAAEHNHMVLTHDLDFGALLAATRATGPSVVQIRTQDVLSKRFEESLVTTLLQF